MKTLITGGGGYIGIVLARRLLEAGEQVKVYDRFYFGRDLFDDLTPHAGLELVRGDLRSIAAEDLVGVDAVIELAGLSNDPSADLNPALTEDINRDAAVRLARLTKQAGIRRFVFSSSCSVYGHGQGRGRLTEESPQNPVSLYARTKIEAEQGILALAGDDFCPVILRNATVYGVAPRMRFDLVVNLMTLYAFKERRIFVLGGGEQWRPLVHVDDVARAFVKARDAGEQKVRGQILNVGSNEQNYKIKHLAHLVSSILGNVAVEEVPQDADKRTYRVNFDKVRDVLDFEVRHDVPSGVREVHDALAAGRIEESTRTRTVAFYQYLLEAEQLIREVSMDGKVF